MLFLFFDTLLSGVPTLICVLGCLYSYALYLIRVHVVYFLGSLFLRSFSNTCSWLFCLCLLFFSEHFTHFFLPSSNISTKRILAQPEHLFVSGIVSISNI